MGKSLPLGARLRYPITITRLLKSRGDTIKKQEPILQYSFKWMKEVGDPITGETWQEEQTTVVDWDSPADGELKEWRVKAGQVITRDQDCIIVEEACSHEIQFQGLCAMCGKDMTEVNWATEHRDTERAPINMTHDQTSLTVSELQATRAEHELQRRLLKQRKLSLVVDLDQTIIHACIEPTIGEWQRDPSNPNYEAVKDVKSFQLNDDGPRGLVSSCWYYIKLRPGLIDFLDRISEMYELHVYTMGTRAYAQNIAKLVDPQQKLFGNRVISRDENGNMTAKSLQRLFPVSTNMVVIIDDRADVWPRNRPNLIKVTPYDFFKGVGDINSSFLPKREGLLTAPPETPVKNGAPANSALPNGGSKDGVASSKVSALEGLASMSSGDDAALLKLQAEEQERELEKQLKERPLLHMQERLDKEDEEAEKGGSEESEVQNGEQATPTHQQRHHLLLDDDDELLYLEQHLTNLHEAFYEAYDAQRARQPHKPVSHRPALPGRKRSNSIDDVEDIDVTSVPDVGEVLDRLKVKVLQGSTIVLSGLVPLGVDVLKSEIGMQAMSFGAQVHTRISKRTTHLVISSNRPRTQKVRQAAKIPSIKIVNQNWLADCLSRWLKLDETPYLVEVHPADRAIAPAPGAIDVTDADTISDEDTDAGVVEEPRSKKPKMKIVISGPGDTFDALNAEDESEDGDGDDDNGTNTDFELPDGQTSPVAEMSFDWGTIDDEMAEFLASGEDDEDDDRESTGGSEASETDRDDASESNFRGSKRKYADDDDDGKSDGEPESALAKKQRIARNRPVSSLREVRTPEAPEDTDTSLPEPQAEEAALLLKSGAVEMPGKDSTGADDEAAQDVDEDEVEADLMAELEAEEHLAEKG
ncbi:FCP1-like phosphatase [Pleurostoma richardsiae]|uniref:RNA polymerase II subunit A C-terminal domain phosphatase n=1 Tax=Pleurostoma richardsiae TaxID=41990 RepID=A0AA38VQ86_9PEZI|nr:FCP1-like phosphatase [Pleurostoma richardsiae]